MNKDLFINEYKIIRNEDTTLLMIAPPTDEKIEDKITLSFKNTPFKINLENNGHLDVFKRLKTIILVVVDIEGNPIEFMELEMHKVVL